MKATLPKITMLLLCAVALLGSSPDYLKEDELTRFSIPFYRQQIPVAYHPAMLISSPREISNPGIKRALGNLRPGATHVLLNSLLEAKQSFELNDFLFYKLARTAVSVIYEGRQQNAQEMTLYQMLLDAGFDARLTFRGHQVFVNVFTTEELFEVPIIDSKGRPYANVSCLQGNCNGRQRLFIYADHPNPTGRSFGFQLRDWPELRAQPVDKKLQFTFHGSVQEVNVTFDQTMVDIMKDYPFIHEYCYLETPLSPTLAATLLPSLKALMRDLTQRQQLELLVSFTRSAFAYKEDNEFFGRSKPMVPEELFGYSYSDCEDRSALFFALVRDLLDLPMAVVAYDDHLTVAIGSETLEGDSFNYQGRRYVFSDPTGPRNSSRIGQIPPGYENKSFTIIGMSK